MAKIVKTDSKGRLVISNVCAIRITDIFEEIEKVWTSEIHKNPATMHSLLEKKVSELVDERANFFEEELLLATVQMEISLIDIRELYVVVDFLTFKGETPSRALVSLESVYGDCLIPEYILLEMSLEQCVIQYNNAILWPGDIKISVEDEIIFVEGDWDSIKVLILWIVENIRKKSTEAVKLKNFVN